VRDKVWRDGEEAALGLYLTRGYRLVARNWTCRLGELDLVLERSGLLVVCEVKARRASGFGGPFEAVTSAKQRKIRSVTQVFLDSIRLRPLEVRFDVASVTEGRVHLFEDAF